MTKLKAGRHLGVGGGAYAEPMENKTRSPIFLFLEICSVQIMGTGMEMIKTSVMTPNAAVAWYIAGRSTHEPIVGGNKRL